jgi:F0F1-type ATP synthase assembly protein I
VSHPPDYPGRQRLKRASARAGSDAYQGAFEAVGAVLVACGVGYWIDGRWETSPWGVVIGAILGFAAMVLRLVRLGKELHPDATQTNGTETDNQTGSESSFEDDTDNGTGVGLMPGMSDVLREDDVAPQEAAPKNVSEKPPGTHERE